MADIEELLRVCSDDDSITRSCSIQSPAASGQGGGKSGPPPLDLSITVDNQGGAFDRTPFLRQTSPCPAPSLTQASQLAALQYQVAALTDSVAAQDRRFERMFRLNGEQMGLLLKLVGAKPSAPAATPLAPGPDTGLSLPSDPVAPTPVQPQVLLFRLTWPLQLILPRSLHLLPQLLSLLPQLWSTLLTQLLSTLLPPP